MKLPWRRKEARNSPELCAAVMEAVGGREGAITEMNRILGPELAAELTQCNGMADQQTLERVMKKVMDKVVEDAINKTGKGR